MSFTDLVILIYENIKRQKGCFFLSPLGVPISSAAFILLVAAIGIANTITISVMVRNKEIGLLKALDATNSDILNLLIGEASGIRRIGGTTLSLLLGNVINIFRFPIFRNRLLQATLPPSPRPYTSQFICYYLLLSFPSLSVAFRVYIQPWKSNQRRR
jgi:putative ABC transport system permease protein